MSNIKDCSTAVLYRKKSDSHGSRENRLTAIRTLFMGVDKIIPALSMFLARFG